MDKYHISVMRNEIEIAIGLLKNYDVIMRDRAESTADMMSDWIGESESEAKRYADKYALIRKERQRINDNIMCLEIALEIADKKE